MNDNQGYKYDSAGNVTKDASNKRFVYDAENKQRSFGTNGSSTNGGTYSYDGDGKRIKKIVGTETTVFVYNASGQLVAEYTATAPTNPTISYLTSDTLGTPRINTDANGQVTARHDYMPFGEEIFNFGGRNSQAGIDAKYQQNDNIRQKFTSKERDEESGLDYFEARYYSSSFGRFASIDPLMASGNAVDPQTWNRYIYVSNNPLRYIDDNGLIKRDKNGNIIFTAVGSPIVTTHPSGASTTVQPGYIEADNGDQIEAFENVGDNTNLDIRFECDCHGLTFADGRYWINDPQVRDLLTGDGYEEINDPQVGDVAIYTEGGEVKHSTTVTAVEGGNVTEVSGLGGIQVSSRTTTPRGGWRTGEAPTYYRRRNDNRTPEQRQADATKVKNYNKGMASIGKQIEREMGPPPPPAPIPQKKRGKRGSDED